MNPERRWKSFQRFLTHSLFLPASKNLGNNNKDHPTRGNDDDDDDNNDNNDNHSYRCKPIMTRRDAMQEHWKVDIRIIGHERTPKPQFHTDDGGVVTMDGWMDACMQACSLHAPERGGSVQNGFWMEPLPPPPPLLPKPRI
eukprot:jgi/Psemu1/16539/gm1.16539_g